MKSFPLFVARRYLVSRKSHNIINIISAISVVGVTIGTMGLIVILSVFNGFGDLVLSLYNTFDPDIKIVATRGKTIDPNDPSILNIASIDGIASINHVLEESALVKYLDRQYVATIKGVSPGFVKMTGIDTMMVEGNFILEHDSIPYAVVGNSVAWSLSLPAGDQIHPLQIYFPRKNAGVSMSPEDAFNRQMIHVSGVFSIQQDFDAKYILVPISFMQELVESENRITAIEIALSTGSDEDAVFKQIKNQTGSTYTVKNRMQQHDFLYKILKSEKLAVYLILSFILLIAVFNIIGSLTMLIIEKEEDINVLWSLGAGLPVLRRIFLLEGMLITLSGAIAGMILGFMVCFLQQKFELITIQNSGSFVIDAYPVKMKILDFIYVLATVIGIGFAAAWFPAGKLVEKSLTRSAGLQIQ